MAQIVISEFMDAPVVDTLFAGRDVLFDDTLVDRPEALFAALADAEALLVRNRTQVNAALLAHAPRLKVVGRLGVGLDNIDLAACRARGVAVCPAAGANDLAVAEYVIAMALVLLRGAYLASERVAAGAWPRMALIGREAAGKTLGLIGYGAIARLTSQKAKALGLAVAAYDPLLDANAPAWRDVARCETLEALLAQADVVSLHVPLTAVTRGMIGAEALKRMKPGAVLINAARGGVVDEAALAEALKAGRLGGAALDVFETEPLTAQAGARFAGVPNLILTPHIAGVSDESNVRVSEVTARNVLAHL
ncbi:MAG: hydroxyacid dehydrogenase [Alphaproteobacteria bacterium]|nr:hydroxyacid dehydrogenase [Alphaproteobacteria bacterium]